MEETLTRKRGRIANETPGYIFTNPKFKRVDDMIELTFQYNDDNGHRKPMTFVGSVINGSMELTKALERM